MHNVHILLFTFTIFGSQPKGCFGVPAAFVWCPYSFFLSPPFIHGSFAWFWYNCCALALSCYYTPSTLSPQGIPAWSQPEATSVPTQGTSTTSPTSRNWIVAIIQQWHLSGSAHKKASMLKGVPENWPRTHRCYIA